MGLFFSKVERGTISIWIELVLNMVTNDSSSGELPYSTVPWTHNCVTTQNLFVACGFLIVLCIIRLMEASGTVFISCQMLLLRRSGFPVVLPPRQQERPWVPPPPPPPPHLPPPTPSALTGRSSLPPFLHTHSLSILLDDRFPSSS